MNAAEWRALIEAYVAGRLSADAFKRRFLEAFHAAAQTRALVPNAVQELAYTVDAYAGDPLARGADIAEDSDLEAAARRALAALPEVVEEPAAAPPPILEPRIDREQARRVVFTTGALGATGCAFALAWLAIVILQFFAVAAQIQSITDWGPAPSTILAIPLAFVPVIGGVVAFFGAKDVWDWPFWGAALVFLLMPLLAIAGGWRAVPRRPG